MRDSTLVGLGIAIWLIYTIDHLLDAKAIKGIATNPRHAFHQRNFKLIVVFSVLTFLFGLWNISFLSIETIKFGGILIFCVGIYFFTIRLVERKSLLHKEVTGALIYNFGVFAGPLSMTYDISLSATFLFFQFLIIVLLNLLIFPLYEIATDKDDGMNSLAISIGEKSVKRIINGLFSLSLVLVAIGLFLFDVSQVERSWFQGQYVILLMMGVLLSLVMWPDLFRKYRLYRILGDGVFYLPALIFL